MHHGLTTAEWATVVGTGFTAFAAVAALATVLVGWRAQRDLHRPYVSAGFLHHTGGGDQAIRFVNAGPGLAIALGYFGVGGDQKYGGLVGRGHLLPNNSEQVLVPPTPGKEATFVWVCRDVHGTSYVHSYDERVKKKSRRWAKRKKPNLGDWFTLMYPDASIPTRADPTASRLSD